MKNLLLTVLSLILVENSIAESIVGVKDGDMVLAVSERLDVTFKNAYGKETSCESVINKLERNRAGIERCLDSAERPRNFCFLLKEDLKREILGKSSSSHMVAEDVEQEWDLQINSHPVSSRDLSVFAQSNNLVLEQIISVQPNISEVDNVALVHSEDSYSNLLSKASVLDLSPSFSVISNESGKVRLKTDSRLTTCEIHSKKAGFKANASVDYNYSVVKNPEERNRLWSLYGKLVDLQTKPYRDWKKFVLAGFLFASDLISTGQNPTEEQVKALEDLFFSAETNSNRFSLQQYRNEYHLGTKLQHVRKNYRHDYSVVGSVE